MNTENSPFFLRSPEGADWLKAFPWEDQALLNHLMDSEGLSLLAESQELLAEDTSESETPKLTCLQLTEAYALLEQAAALRLLLDRVHKLLNAQYARLGVLQITESYYQPESEYQPGMVNHHRTRQVRTRLVARIDAILEEIDYAAHAQLISIDPTLLPY